MRSLWFRPEPVDQPEPEWPSVWPHVLFYVVIQAICVVVVILLWPEGKPPGTLRFYAAMLLPALPALIVVSGFFHYFTYEQAMARASLWNRLCHQWRCDWRGWAQAHVAIVASVVLAPEDDIAERMLGLEGSAPVNAGKILPLAIDAPAGTTRLACVLEQLLRPLATAITARERAGGYRVVLQTNREADLEVLRMVVRDLDLPLKATDLSWVSAAEARPMSDLWGKKPLSGSLLVLACQLHDPTTAPECSELALGLLLSQPKVLVHTKPQACLYRAISSGTTPVEHALATLLRAEQTPLTRLRHFWFTRLDSRSRHAVTTAVADLDRPVGIQDIDRCLGPAGPASDWLPAALAAHMVDHGQGSQLIATRHDGEVTLNVVAMPSARPAVPPPAVTLPKLWYSSTIILGGSLFVLDVLYAGNGPMRLSWWAYLIVTVCVLAYFALLEAVTLSATVVHFKNRHLS